MAITRKVRRPAKAQKLPTSIPSGIKLPGPEELTEPSDNLMDYTILIFGEKGIGKTSLCSEFPGALVVMTEPLRKNLRIRQFSLEVLSIPAMEKAEVNRTPWQVFKQVVEMVLEDSTIQVLVGDTIDRLYTACLNHHCYELGIRDPSSQNDFGGTWRLIKDDFEDTLNQVRIGGKGLILTSHAQMREVEARNGATYDLCIPTCSPAAFGYVKAACDYAWYYGYHNRDRALYLRGNDLIWSACNVEDRFLDPDGNPIHVLKLGNTSAQAYRDVMAGWDNKAYDIEHVADPPRRKKKDS